MTKKKQVFLSPQEIIERDAHIVKTRKLKSLKSKRNFTYDEIGKTLPAFNKKWPALTRERVRQVLKRKAPDLTGRL